MPAKILCVGDVMIDVSVQVPKYGVDGKERRANIQLGGGGAAANVACWLASAKDDPFLITRVGNDFAGRFLIEEIERFGVRHSQQTISEKSTGVVVVLIDETGERTMYPDSGANEGLSLLDLPKEQDFDGAYISGYSLINKNSRSGVIEIIKHLKERGVKIWFDPSTVGIMAETNLATIQEWLSLVDVLCLNEEEAAFITGTSNPLTALDLLLGLTPLVVIKRGRLGAIGKVRGEEIVNVPALPTELIDSTGAGDAFMAGLISEYSNSQNLATAINFANELGSKCVTKLGSRPLVAPR
jgi:sugar/nucleoside kinase (ribokinase family)